MQGDFNLNEGNSSPTVPSGSPIPSAAPSTLEFQKLDRRIIRLWRITRTIGFSLLLIIASIILFVMSLAVPPLLSLLPFILGFLLIVVCFYIIWYPPRAYQAWGYRINSKVIEARQGVFFHSTHLLPLNRLQHVDIHRGPLDRAHGLSSLLLHTAAATLVIPGLDQHEAQRLRDYLVEIGGDDAV